MGAGEQYRSCPLFDCDLLSDAISFEAAEPAEPHERRLVYEDTEEIKTGIGDKLGPRRCWARAAETGGGYRAADAVSSLNRSRLSWYSLYTGPGDGEQLKSR